MVERQLRRYFIGLISFGFVVTSIAVGVLAAFLGVLAVLATSLVIPALFDTRRVRRRPSQRRVGNVARTRAVTARPLGEDAAEELPLVPDEPSLIIGVSS
jgi:hypothetical protein